MGTIVAVSNIKGGSGKSTLSVNLAVEAAEGGLEVLLVDTDIQRSAVGWASIRADDDRRVYVPSTQMMESRLLLQEAKRWRQSHDLVVIDTAGRDAETTRAALVVADDVIMPVRPGSPDVWATVTASAQLLFEVMADGKERGAVVVANAVLQGSRTLKESLAAMEDEFDGRLALAKTQLVNRVAWDHAFGQGLGVREHEPRGKAANELRQLCSELDLPVND